jgi:CTP synthase
VPLRRYLAKEVREKIALFCDVDVDAVVTACDVKSVYEIPLTLAAQGVDEIVLRLLKLPALGHRADLTCWSAMV